MATVASRPTWPESQQLPTRTPRVANAAIAAVTVDPLTRKLPLTAFLVRSRWWLLPVAILLAVILASREPMLGWSVMLAWAILPAMACDRPFHSLSLVGPTTFAAGVLFLKFGVGLPMAIFGGYEVEPAAVFNCGCFALTLTCTLLGVSALLAPSATYRSAVDQSIRRAERDLGRVGLLIFAYALTLDVVLVATGGLDRSVSSAKAYDYGEMGWWSWFALFQDIASIGVFLLPFGARLLPAPVRVLVYGAVFARAGLYLLSGSRSGALFPLLFLAIGTISVAKSLPKRFELWAVVGFTFMLPVIDFIDYMRNSRSFHETKVTNLGDRISAAGKAITTLREEDDERRAKSTFVTGRALLEFADPIVYERTPNPVPFAGYGDVGNLAYAFVPRYFMPRKPILMDGNEIVVSYTGFRMKGTSAIISLNADLYRRSGVSGVLIGGVISALLVVLYLNLSMFVMRRVDPAFGILMVVMLVILGFRHPLYHWTVLSLGSYYLYSFPKFLFGLAAALFFTRSVFCLSRPALRVG